MTEETIFIMTEDIESSDIEGQRNWSQNIQKRLSKAAEIPVSLLEQNMNHFLELVRRIFQQIDQRVATSSDLCLDEVELQVEISGKGEVKLFAGGELAGKGVITLKFKRQK
jgi:hypothetical protein